MVLIEITKINQLFHKNKFYYKSNINFVNYKSEFINLQK